MNFGKEGIEEEIGRMKNSEKRVLRVLRVVKVSLYHEHSCYLRFRCVVAKPVTIAIMLSELYEHDAIARREVHL